jgi:hypothetical protein
MANVKPIKPEGTTPMSSGKGAHGGGNPYFQMTIKDAFEIQKRNQQANIDQKISTPKKG